MLPSILKACLSWIRINQSNSKSDVLGDVRSARQKEFNDKIERLSLSPKNYSNGTINECGFEEGLKMLMEGNGIKPAIVIHHSGQRAPISFANIDYSLFAIPQNARPKIEYRTSNDNSGTRLGQKKDIKRRRNNL